MSFSPGWKSEQRANNGSRITTEARRSTEWLCMPPLSSLLNPVDLPPLPPEDHGLDVSVQLAMLADILSQPHPSRVPLDVKNSLDTILKHFQNPINSHVAQLGIQQTSSLIRHPQVDADTDTLEPKIEQRVKLNKKTTLEILYTYGSPNSLVEYPETRKNGFIGHLFSMDPKSWISPARNFIYSLGEPRGTNGTEAKPESCQLLVDKDGRRVPCKISHSTCKLSLNLYYKLQCV